MDSALSLIHVGSAVVWGGWTFVFAWFVLPAGSAAGPAAGPFMTALMQRTRLQSVMGWIPPITVLAGIGLWIVRYGSEPPPGYRGVALVVGAVAGVAALVLGSFQGRNARRLGRVTESVPAGTSLSSEQAGQIDQIRTAMTATARRTAWVMVVAVTGMALAG
jgi:hypothetical protein